MEETKVLDAESKAAPLQTPVAIEANPVLESIQQRDVGNEPQLQMEVLNPQTVGPIGEKDHASEIANNMNNYSYNSPIDQSKEPTVTTQSTTKGNISDKTTWESEYTMEDKFRAQDDSDYKWNKLAAERSQYSYNQEATQVLSEYAKSMQEIKEAGAMAMDQFFAATYTSNQTADKMGWDGGGQATSQERQVAFLKASTAANMYSKFELQEYGLNSQLSVARMYAEANMQALALDIYRDELNKAVSESELTGFYISPEASEIMKQQDMAKNILAKPNITDAERARAEGVIAAGNAYFDKLGFSKDEKGNYVGRELLASLELKETKRANLRNEELQEQANQIAKAGVYAPDGKTWAEKNYNLAKDEYELLLRNTEVMETMEAWRTFGGDESTGRGSFVKVNGTYKGVTNVRTNNGHTYADYNGKTVEITPGKNHEGYDIVQTYDKSSYGYFSNGYQPKGIEGEGAVKDTGNKVTVDDRVNNKKTTQTVWETTNEKGETKYWYWDGVSRTYKETDKNVGQGGNKQITIVDNKTTTTTDTLRGSAITYAKNKYGTKGGEAVEYYLKNGNAGRSKAAQDAYILEKYGAEGLQAVEWCRQHY